MNVFFIMDQKSFLHSAVLVFMSIYPGHAQRHRPHSELVMQFEKKIHLCFLRKKKHLCFLQKKNMFFMRKNKIRKKRVFFCITTLNPHIAGVTSVLALVDNPNIDYCWAVMRSGVDDCFCSFSTPLPNCNHKYNKLKLKSSWATYPIINAKSQACDTANEHALTCTRETCSCSQTAVQRNQWRWSIHII